jgi:hypothetical protein
LPEHLISKCSQQAEVLAIWTRIGPTSFATLGTLAEVSADPIVLGLYLRLCSLLHYGPEAFVWRAASRSSCRVFLVWLPLALWSWSPQTDSGRCPFILQPAFGFPVVVELGSGTGESERHIHMHGRPRWLLERVHSILVVV